MHFQTFSRRPPRSCAFSSGDAREEVHSFGCANFFNALFWLQGLPSWARRQPTQQSQARQAARPKRTRTRTKRANNDKWLFSYIQINTPTLQGGCQWVGVGVGAELCNYFVQTSAAEAEGAVQCLCHWLCHCLLPISNHPWRAETESRLSGRRGASGGGETARGERGGNRKPETGVCLTRRLHSITLPVGAGSSGAAGRGGGRSHVKRRITSVT